MKDLDLLINFGLHLSRREIYTYNEAGIIVSVQFPRFEQPRIVVSDDVNINFPVLNL